MAITNTRTRPVFPWGGIAVMLLLLCMGPGCSREDAPQPGKTSKPQGFTFFDLGANSLYSHGVRQDLRRQLGSDAISRRNTMDLSIHDKGFLETHFPALAELNRRLNWPAGQRVEHNTTRLAFRYAQGQNTPFLFVELYFSDDTQKPLLFRITASPEGAAIVETIVQKYGPPREFEWGQRQGRTLFWEEGRDVFVVSSFLNRREEREYLFCIYFVNNLEEMVKTEEAQRNTEEERLRRAGESAF